MPEGTCSVATCVKPVFGRGWCQPHYKRWQKHGDVRAHIPVISPNRPMAERFWEKVDKDGPLPEHRPDLGQCWIWTKATDPKGYGQFKAHGGMRLAHRIAWELTNGPIDLPQLDHLCRRTSCVRPSHLDPVTNLQNHQRAQPFLELPTHCPQGHPYSGDNLYLHTKKYQNRRCRRCLRDHMRIYRLQKKNGSVGSGGASEHKGT